MTASRNNGLYGKSLLLTDDYSAGELDSLVSAAERFAALDRAGEKTPLLANELAYALFFDNSTRTKSAWAGAAARLGMQPVIVDGSSTQVSHGETAAETGAMLGMNAHALGVRHDLILVPAIQPFVAQTRLVRGQTVEPSIGKTQAVSASRGCRTIGKPMSPTFFGMARPMRTHAFDGRSIR